MDYIVRETCSEIRTLSRLALRDNWVKVALAVAIYYLLTSTLPLAIDELVPGATITRYNEMLGENEVIPLVSPVYQFLLTGVFEVGLCSYMIYFFRRKEISATHLFDGFEHFFKTLLLTLVVTFFTFLWTLLFIIPGIIAIFRYSQAYVILADHPELGVMECIRRSKMYMKGNKGKYFCLTLSYIGWLILGAILPAIVLNFFEGVTYVAVDFLASIPNFFVMAYFQTGLIVFYELVSKNLVAAPKEIPTEEFEF